MKLIEISEEKVNLNSQIQVQGNYYNMIGTS